ncbi:hypothetical protein [uncultured Psychroserpens sp.]|uniref:hypothetical protein n=1 Tax=uncultured Psychroserpens sp. TaxID=255436 RepID=UPI002626C280|nr:hypothetical protein [uncultured Psychroserpens sp.]
MKTKQFITGVFSMLIIYCFAFTFVGCSDDDGGIDEPAILNYRVAEKVSTEISGSNIYEDKSVYNYIDNRLMEIIELDKENGSWIDDRKTEFEYNGDWVSSSRYYKDGDEWVSQGMQSSDQIKIVDGKIVEIKYTSINYTSSTVYTYSGDKIIKVESFTNGELNSKYVCTYDGDNLDEIIEYDYNGGIEEFDYKYEFSYTNGNLTELLSYYFNEGVWKNSDKDVYSYSGNKVTQIDDYDYNSFTETWELDDSVYYSYNNLGLLESISESGEGWSWEEMYTYEDGIGNYKLLQGEGGYYEIFNYPTAQRTSDTNASTDDRALNLKRFLLH